MSGSDSRLRGVPTLGYAISFEQRIVDTTPDRAYRIIDDWLRSQKAKVKSSNAASFIEASHGRSFQPMGWRKDAKKTMRFTILQEAADVLVRVDIAPALVNVSDVRAREDEARSNWNELLTNLWAQFGPISFEQSSVPVVDWELSLKRSKRMVLSGLLVMLVGAIATLFSPSDFHRSSCRWGPLCSKRSHKHALRQETAFAPDSTSLIAWPEGTTRRVRRIVPPINS